VQITQIIESNWNPKSESLPAVISRLLRDKDKLADDGFPVLDPLYVGILEELQKDLQKLIKAKAQSGIASATSTLDAYQSWLKDNEETLDSIQDAVAFLGFVPLLGDVLDGVNTVAYLARGRYQDAALSGAAMVPMLGMAAGFKKVSKVFDKVLGTESTAAKILEKNVDHAKVGDRVADAVQGGNLARKLLVPPINFQQQVGKRLQFDIFPNGNKYHLAFDVDLVKDGKTLVLEDLAVLPADLKVLFGLQKPQGVGPGGVAGLVNELVEQARAQGFKEIKITAKLMEKNFKPVQRIYKLND